MYIVIVQLHVKADKIEPFLQHTLENARKTRQEPGCLRFDVLKSEADPTRFALHEVYRTPDGLKAHQETEHYKKWRDNVPELLAEPRVGTRYLNVSPADDEW